MNKEIEKEEGKNYYHYGLNFKKNIEKKTANKETNIGYIISGAFGKRELYGAVFLTNAEFQNEKTAKNYLCLTYTPKFGYKVEKLGSLSPKHISDSTNHIISKRTSPAFGKFGGVGEWILDISSFAKGLKRGNQTPIIVNNYYDKGGETERWYMGSWNRELLANFLSCYTGVYIKDNIIEISVERVIKIDDEKEKIGRNEKYFWNTEGDSALIAKPGRIVAYSPIAKNEYKIKDREYLSITYLSVSCAYYQINGDIYIKFWGALWEDHFIPNYIEITNLETKTCDECMAFGIEKELIEIINKDKYIGVRVSLFPIRINELFFPGFPNQDNERIEFIKEISNLINKIKEELKNLYNKKCPFKILGNNFNCNYPFNITLLPKLEVNIKL